mgnify:CR=1 FL=1
MVKTRIFSKAECLKVSRMLRRDYGEEVKVIPIQEITEPENLPCDDFDGAFLYKSSDNRSRISMRGKFARSFAQRLWQSL